MGITISTPPFLMTPRIYAGEESIKFPNGLIVKWGSKNVASDTWINTTVTFSQAFPNSCVNVQLTAGSSNIINDFSYFLMSHTLAAASFKIRSRYGTAQSPIRWYAIGY